MERLKLIIISIIFITTGSLIFAQQKDAQKTTFSVDNWGELEMNINPGDIKIETWDKKEVQVWTSGIDINESENLTITQDRNKISLRYNSKWGWAKGAEFLIKMPKKFSVSARTSAGDFVTTGEIEGDVFASTAGGDISAASVSGEVQLSSAGGDISVTDIKGNLSLKTQGGDVETGNLYGEFSNITTMGGNIYIKSAKNKLGANTYGGDIETGEINGNNMLRTFGGDIEIKEANEDTFAETSGGDITIKKGSGKFRVTTSGGDLFLENIKGSGEFKTRSGSVELNLLSANGNIDVEAAHGDIALKIPDNLKVVIYAKIIGQGGRNSNEIISDFKFESEPGDSKTHREAKIVLNSGADLK